MLGSGVNIASRVETVSPEGGIEISDKVQRDIAYHADLRTQSIGFPKLKGIDIEFEFFLRDQLRAAGGDEPRQGGDRWGGFREEIGSADCGRFSRVCAGRFGVRFSEAGRNGGSERDSV